MLCSRRRHGAVLDSWSRGCRAAVVELELPKAALSPPGRCTAQPPPEGWSSPYPYPSAVWPPVRPSSIPPRPCPCHAGAARRFPLAVYISRNFGPAIDYMIWTARPGGLPSPLPCSRRGIEPPFAQQDGQHILLQATYLFAANTIVLVAQYRPVCHEPFGAVRAAQSSALKCVRRHHKSMVRVVLVSDFCLQGCTQQIRHDVCARHLTCRALRATVGLPR